MVSVVAAIRVSSQDVGRKDQEEHPCYEGQLVEQADERCALHVPVNECLPLKEFSG